MRKYDVTRCLSELPCNLKEVEYLSQCCESVTFGSAPLTTDLDPDSAIFILDLQKAKKKRKSYFFLDFSAYYFLKVGYINIIFLR